MKMNGMKNIKFTKMYVFSEVITDLHILLHYMTIFPYEVKK
jgi:hypothetical protein